MSDTSWQIEDSHPDEGAASGAAATWVSLHFLIAALRRRWKVWVGLACVGLLLGVAWTFAVPAKSTGTVTLFLAHDPMANPEQAASTDLSLLRTRTVARSVIDDLGLKTSPEALQKSITATSDSSSVLVLQIPAPDGDAAVARAKALAENYLEFRSEQLKNQSDALISGYEKRIASMKQEVDRLTKQYGLLSSENDPDARSQATDVLGQRSQINGEIISLQQTVEDTALKTNSVITATTVLDPPSVVPYSNPKRVVLTMVSGLVGGAAFGVALVLFLAITSDRLRRRDELALALGTPVRYSVSGLRRAPRGRPVRSRSSTARDVAVLVHALGSMVSVSKSGARKPRSSRLALAAVDNEPVAELLLTSLAEQLARRGKKVFLVDLSETGHLEAAVQRAFRRQRPHPPRADIPVVFRPKGVPSLARGPVGARSGAAIDLPRSDRRRAAWDAADVVLTLAKVDPAVGVEHLKSWTDQLILLVTAGRSSAERLRTTGNLIRSAGLRMPFTMLVGADGTDESVGLPEIGDVGLPSARRTS